jgi:hypothetical protein
MLTPDRDVALAILGAFGVIVLLSLMGAYLVIGMAWERSPLRTNGRGSPKLSLSGWRLIARAIALVCHRCGVGRIFDSRFRMRVSRPKFRFLTLRN